MDEDEGIFAEVEDEDSDVVETDDGGALVDLGDDAKPGDSQFYDNLADTLPPTELGTLATNLLELIGYDKESRKKRDDQYAEGLRRTGLGDDAPGGAQFQGASKVVHPMLTEACVDFSARAMKEMFPASGPVKDSIPGKVTEAKLAKARRKTSLMNWQLTVQCREFRAEMEQLMTQVPMGGVQYLKAGWNERRNRPEFLFVGVDEMYLPFAATNFYTAQRRTHVEYVTKADYQRRVAEGEWVDVDLPAPGMIPEMSRTTYANDKIEGRDATSYNEDGLRTVLAVYTSAAIMGDPETGGETAPYIITIDESTRNVLAVYRNWEEGDDRREELQWFVEWPFIPWRGAYPIGLPHMIGGLSAAATGSLRALLDSAHINNTPSMLKLKGAHIGGQTTSPTVGEITEIEGGFNVDDIRKIAMPLPFNQPSGMLLELLGFVVNAAKNVVRTSLDEMPDMQADVPVGTTMARMEQGLQVYSAIHGRLHDAMGRLLGILHRLNGTYLDDKKLKKEVGEDLATRADFDGPIDVIPVSDPNIFSEVQRIAQTQMVAQRADLKPQLYDQRKVEEFVLTRLKLPEGVDLLLPAPQPKEQNAVNENVAASLGRPVTAFPEQDHLAHLQTHLAYLQSPMFGMMPLIAPAFIPAILSHIREHVVLWYASVVFAEASEAMQMDLGDLMRDMEGEHMPNARKEMDRMLAEASTLALTDGAEVFASLPPIIMQAQQVMQQFQPQGVEDPILQIENRKIDEKAKADAGKLQLDTQEHSDDMAMERERILAEQQRDQANNAADIAMNDADNQTATQLTVMKLMGDAGGRAAQNPNPNPIP